MRRNVTTNASRRINPATTLLSVSHGFSTEGLMAKEANESFHSSNIPTLIVDGGRR